jgi:hypothetical protein
VDQVVDTVGNLGEAVRCAALGGLVNFVGQLGQDSPFWTQVFSSVRLRPSAWYSLAIARSFKP